MAVTAASGVGLRAASLFDVDPELGELLDARQVSEARARAIVAVADLGAGEWSPDTLLRAGARPFALLVIEGMVLREMLLTGSTSTELLGPTDIVDLGPSDDALLPTKIRWSVPEAACVAVLDDRLLGIMRTWPGVARILLVRAAQREARLCTHRAIAQLPRVDQRLLAFFGHLAERWGRVAATGVIVPLHLTHETLGRLIGARRPTVSLALKDLSESGLLERRSDGAWHLTYKAFEHLGATAAIPRGWQPADARPVGEPRVEDEREQLPVVRNRIDADDMRALRARFDALREQYATRVSRSAVVLDRSRAARGALHPGHAERRHA